MAEKRQKKNCKKQKATTTATTQIDHRRSFDWTDPMNFGPNNIEKYDNVF